VLTSALGALLLGASLLAAPREAAALVGHYAAGALNARDLFLPPVNGTFFALYTYFYIADTFRDRNGHAVDSVTIRGRTINLDTTINLNSISPGLMWIPKWEFLGARYGAFLVFSAANPSLNSAIETVNRRLEFDTSTWGFGDLFVQPVWFQWSWPHVDLTAAYGFYAPTGRFETGATDNIGLGFWTHQLQSAIAVYVDEAKTWSFSLGQTWEINSQLVDQDVTPGTRANLNWAISKIWQEGLLETAVVAYDQWQVTDDRGSDVLPLFKGVKDQVHAAGVQLGMPKYGFAIKYLHEFGAVNRFQGNLVTFSLGLPLDPLFERLADMVQ
jgi:hypothetical protein